MNNMRPRNDFVLITGDNNPLGTGAATTHTSAPGGVALRLLSFPTTVSVPDGAAALRRDSQA